MTSPEREFPAFETFCESMRALNSNVPLGPEFIRAVYGMAQERRRRESLVLEEEKLNRERRSKIKRVMTLFPFPHIQLTHQEAVSASSICLACMSSSSCRH